jgi:hypothetical protein
MEAQTQGRGMPVVTLSHAISEARRIGLTVRDLEIIARMNDDFIAAIMALVEKHDTIGLVEVA